MVAEPAELGNVIPVSRRAEDADRRIGGIYYTDDLLAESFEFKDGYVTVPTGPGFGIDVDEAKVDPNVLNEALDKVKNLGGRLSKMKEVGESVAEAVIATAETQGTVFAASFAEGYFGEEKMDVGPVDMRLGGGLVVDLGHHVELEEVIPAAERPELVPPPLPRLVRHRRGPRHDRAHHGAVAADRRLRPPVRHRDRAGRQRAGRVHRQSLVRPPSRPRAACISRAGRRT